MCLYWSSVIQVYTREYFARMCNFYCITFPLLWVLIYLVFESMSWINLFYRFTFEMCLHSLLFPTSKVFSFCSIELNVTLLLANMSSSWLSSRSIWAQGINFRLMLRTIEVYQAESVFRTKFAYSTLSNCWMTLTFDISYFWGSFSFTRNIYCIHKRKLKTDFEFGIIANIVFNAWFLHLQSRIEFSLKN